MVSDESYMYSRCLSCSSDLCRKSPCCTRASGFPHIVSHLCSPHPPPRSPATFPPLVSETSSAVPCVSALEGLDARGPLISMIPVRPAVAVSLSSAHAASAIAFTFTAPHPHPAGSNRSHSRLYPRPYKFPRFLLSFSPPVCPVLVYGDD